MKSKAFRINLLLFVFIGFLTFGIIFIGCGGVDYNSNEVRNFNEDSNSKEDYWEPYIGYWAGSKTNVNGVEVSLEVSIWEGGTVDLRLETADHQCFMTGEIPGDWENSYYTHTNQDGGGIISIFFLNSGTASITVDSRSSCFSCTGYIVKERTRPKWF